MELGTKEFNDSAMEMFGGKPKQQTAVEWLRQELLKRDMDISIKDLFEQAKEMEKQQIMDANITGVNQGLYSYKNAEEYYNAIFKKKKRS